ncbi:MAG: ComF family protein [Jatrophihabitans sp.]|nr:MAG: ComF family protein [Jatrophihabitans sp.]
MLTALLDLVLPRTCAGCGRPGVPLCGRCRPPGPVPALEGRVRAAGAYAGGLRTALLAYKERGRRELALPLGMLLATALPPEPGGCVLVPVPSRPAAARARGGDHVLRLARVAARESGMPVRPALRLGRAVADSARLTRAQRRSNLAGAMAAEPAPGATALVIDDIVTTGATLREAVRALRAAGWPVAGAAVVAATPSPVPHRAGDGAGTEQDAGLAWG